MKSLLICFIGIDGSGKTTLSKMLVEELRSRGIRSRYVYGRFQPVMTAPFFKTVSALMPFKKNPRRHYHARLKNRRHLLSSPIISKLFIIGILFDQIFQILVKVRLPSIFRKEVIVCDRYFFDTVIVDIALSYDIGNEDVMRLLKEYLPLFPKAHLVIFVSVPPGIAYQRKKDIVSRETLEKLSSTYSYVAKHFASMKIDGTKNPSELKSVLLSRIELSTISLNQK